MRVLFIGGTGIISSACSELALQRGIELELLCRRRSPRPCAEGARIWDADIRDAARVSRLLAGQRFDCVVDFIAFTPEHIRADIELFADKTRQYVFISSASAYKKPVDQWPITESTPLHNPFWEYSRNKIACEELLLRAYREQGFPATIVRPSHTYDRTLLPFDPHLAGNTVLSRMRRGRPLVVHGDGSSLWVLTHHRDFAKGFVGLLGNPKAIGEAYHITSDELLSWNQIYQLVANAAGCDARLVHIASSTIAKINPDWGAALLGDKAHSVIFDNSKIKRLVPDYCASIPFAQGAREVVEFYDQHPDFMPVNPALDELMDDLIERFG
jgi:nucleoside-diphosphate-sugar epimerase